MYYITVKTKSSFQYNAPMMMYERGNVEIIEPPPNYERVHQQQFQQENNGVETIQHCTNANSNDNVHHGHQQQNGQQNVSEGLSGSDNNGVRSGVSATEAAANCNRTKEIAIETVITSQPLATAKKVTGDGGTGNGKQCEDDVGCCACWCPSYDPTRSNRIAPITEAWQHTTKWNFRLNGEQIASGQTQMTSISEQTATSGTQMDKIKHGNQKQVGNCGGQMYKEDEQCACRCFRCCWCLC